MTLDKKCRSWVTITTLARDFPFVKGLRLSRNFGHQNALIAGLRATVGDAIISMDADLQHPPDVIPLLLSEWRKGAEIVSTRRISSDETTLLKRLASKYFYSLFSRIAEVKLSEGSSDFRLMGRRSLEALLDMEPR